jgi:diaminopimelate decarboxylase
VTLTVHSRSPMPDPTPLELLTARPALRMDAQGGLLFEDVKLIDIARAYATPTWVYGAGTLKTRYRRLKAAFPGTQIHYAVKANDHLAVLTILAREGAGADVVSEGEFLRALKAGIPPDRIVFSGVGKTAAELGLALRHHIGTINVESAEELWALAALAGAAQTTARVALRVNPEVDAGTHEKISTGRKGDKFGIPIADVPALYAEAAGRPFITMQGLAVHIGSQIFGLGPYQAAYGKLAGLVRELHARNLPVHSVDCGGGLGVAYRNEPAPLPEAWAAVAKSAFAGLDLSLTIEPGRWIAAPAGVLLTSVIRSRRCKTMPRPLHIIDAAMNDFARPAMYGAWHGVLPLSPAALHAPLEEADFAGPVCESSDFLARHRATPPLHEGDLVAILDVGAYGAVMSSSYNARPHAAQVMVHDGKASLIRPRQGAEDLWSDETVPTLT